MTKARTLPLLLVATLLITLLAPFLDLGGRALAQSQRVIACDNPPAPAYVYFNNFIAGWTATGWNGATITPSAAHVLTPTTSRLLAFIPGKQGAAGVEFSNPNYRSNGHSRFSFFVWDPTGDFDDLLSVMAFNQETGKYDGIRAKMKYESSQVIGDGWRYVGVNLFQLTFTFRPATPIITSTASITQLATNKIAIVNESGVNVNVYISMPAFDWHQGYALGPCIPGDFGDGSFIIIEPQTVRPGDTIRLTVFQLPGANLRSDLVGLVCSSDNFRTYINNTWISGPVDVGNTPPNGITLRVPPGPLLRSGDQCRAFLWDADGKEFIASTTFTLQ